MRLTLIAPMMFSLVYTFPLLRRDVDPSLVPQFGLQSGLNPTGTGDCDGIDNAAGVPIKIPCRCPPDRASFLVALNENVAQGHAVNNTGVPVSFPTDDSKASQLARIQATLVTLQNLLGPGVGCPAASTTLLAQEQAIQDGSDVAAAPPLPQQPAAPKPSQDPSPPTPTLPPDAPVTQPGSTVPLVNAALVPEFGHPSGLNPTGTGDCDGITNAAGVVIKVPCRCPPDRNSFILSLSENVQKGFAVNNTAIAVSFPTDDSKASKLARIQTTLVTLQNLLGPGVGCPAASTTLLAQQKAIADGP